MKDTNDAIDSSHATAQRVARYAREVMTGGGLVMASHRPDCGQTGAMNFTGQRPTLVPA